MRRNFYESIDDWDTCTVMKATWTDLFHVNGSINWLGRIGTELLSRLPTCMIQTIIVPAIVFFCLWFITMAEPRERSPLLLEKNRGRKTAFLELDVILTAQKVP